MSDIRYTNRATAWFLAMAMLVCGTAAEAVVVCVGLDGHADVEITTTGCCSAGLGDPNELLTASVALSSDSCAGCVDLGLEVESLTAAKRTQHSPRYAIPRRLIAAVLPDSVAVVATVSAADHDWVSDVLSSVVLRT